MNTTKRHLFFVIHCIVVLFVFSGCNSDSKDSTATVIDLSNGVQTVNELDLSDFASSVRYVKLETSDENILGEITKVMYEDEMILISDNQEKHVFVFNKDGSFKQKVGKIGQGPEEYVKLSWFDYLPKNNEILIQSYSWNAHFYDLEGNFRNKFDFKQLSENNPTISGLPFRIMYINPSTYAVDINIGGTPLSKLTVINSAQEILLDIPNEKPFVFDFGELGAILGTIRVPETDVVLYRNKDKIVHYGLYEDTIRIIDNKWNVKYMEFNFGNYKYNGSNEKFFRVQEMLEFSNSLLLKFEARGLSPEPFDYNSRGSRGMTITSHDILGIYDKKTGELVFLKQPQQGKLGFKNNIDGGLPFWPKSITSRDEMITYYHADEFIEAFQGKEDAPKEVKAILKDLKEDEDNPVIAIATPRK